MKKGYPDRQTAQKIWLDGINFRLAHTPFKTCDEYIFHTTGVAESACKIASKTPYLNSEKAYILGLLHDYGKKYDERRDKIFHVRAGYEELLAMGYPQSAKICLTHSFPFQDFDDESYSSYFPEWRDWARQKLKDLIYDDYDRLIQLCDLFFEGLQKVSFEKRLKGIVCRYGLRSEQVSELRRGAEQNKAYFDSLCGKDVYKILNISAL